MVQVVLRAIERGEVTAAYRPGWCPCPATYFTMNLSCVPDETIVDIVDTVFLALGTKPRTTSLG